MCRRIVSAEKTVVCRLTATIETLEQRVGMREAGISKREYVTRVAKLNAILDAAGLEDFIIINENRTVTDVAQELLMRAGWISNSLG
jgi:hypothetical protein